MSWVYWGIVVGLLAMVATVFECVAILYSNPKGSPKEPNSKVDEPGEAVTHASADHRRAA
ncbi:MAG TPA: hypothetical protein VLM19_08360 [Nitrospiraceae bacterium]|jgi:hypothetical protein|nr:hypothetical protein [Nitrospiraceae bacterium]